MNSYELKYHTYDYIAGVDEVGRGCLFGPVVAAAVILPKDFDFSKIDDSKKLSKKKREMLYETIIRSAICYNVAFIDNNEIDKVNILKATKQAMKQALVSLRIVPDVVLIDAVKLDVNYISESIIKGDTLSYSIAAASIVAKVSRDNYITSLSNEYPQYDLANNMGYGTKKHVEALYKYGATKYHRKTFRPVSEIIKE